jgi:hypothetical protein
LISVFGSLYGRTHPGKLIDYLFRLPKDKPSFFRVLFLKEKMQKKVIDGVKFGKLEFN